MGRPDWRADRSVRPYLDDRDAQKRRTDQGRREASCCLESRGQFAMKISRIIAIVLAVLFFLAVARLGYLNEGGPAHDDLMLPGMEPATLYLPGSDYPFFQSPKPAAERPAAVVLVHGFTADRETMSALARRITENGYAVIDRKS